MTKQLLNSVKTLLLLCSLFIGQSLMAQFEYNGILYERIGATFEAKVMGINPIAGVQPNLVIPSVVVTLADGDMFTFQVTSIADQAFSGITAIRELTLPATITNIGSGAFANIPLISVTYLGTTEPSIGSSAFTMNSAGIVSFPNVSGGFTPALWGVTAGQMRYGGGTTPDPVFSATPDNISFSAAGGIEYINLYSPVSWTASATPSTGISLNPTSGQANTNAIIEVTLQENTAAIARKFNISFINDGGTEVGSVEITQAAPSGAPVTFPVDNFFYEQTGTNEVTIRGFYPTTMSSPEVVIPETVMNAGLSFTVTAIADQAFVSKPIQTLTIPATVSAIGSGAFANCPLQFITYLGSTEPSINSSAFTMSSTRKLVLPNASGGFTSTLWGIPVGGLVEYGGTETTYYTVKYIVDGVVIDEVSVLANSLLTKPQDPVKSGYALDGWARTDGNYWNFTTDRVTETVMLSAMWRSAENPFVTATANTTSFSAEGGSTSATVTSNVPWVAMVSPATFQPYISINPQQVSAPAPQGMPVAITLQPNPTTATRTFTVMFYDATNPNLSVALATLTITQAAKQPIVYGCTDRFSENYNPNANTNDGTCTYKKIDEPISGCMDTLSLNYNPVATVADNSCIYPSQEPQVIYGCTDCKALNFNPLATDYEAGSCLYANEENIFNAETEETPVDTIGTKPIENCALSINVAITDVSISKVEVLTSHEVKVHWVIELEGGITILYTANYEVSQSGVTLFYLSIICKEGALRAKSLRAASEEAGVTGFTVSATYDVDLGVTGICQPKAEASNFVVYPNPANSILNVKLEKQADNATLALFDTSGKMVLSQAINGNSAQINISSLNAGNYILRVVENGAASVGVQVIKQ